jgi:hypothetical protein
MARHAVDRDEPAASLEAVDRRAGRAGLEPFDEGEAAAKGDAEVPRGCEVGRDQPPGRPAPPQVVLEPVDAGEPRREDL